MSREAIKVTAANLAAELFASEAAKSTKKRSEYGKFYPADNGEVVLSFVDNPKKVGSATHTRYGFWRVGMTKTDAMAAGLTKADIDYDTKKGFVVFGTAE